MHFALKSDYFPHAISRLDRVWHPCKYFYTIDLHQWSSIPCMCGALWLARLISVFGAMANRVLRSIYNWPLLFDLCCFSIPSQACGKLEDFRNDLAVHLTR
jgi:hypothetical protein